MFHAIQSANCETLNNNMKTCKVISRENCQKIINKYGAGPLELVGFEVLPLGEEPMGFLGEHWRVRITVKTWKSKTTTLDFFMKTVPDSISAHKNYVVHSGIFKKEAMLYNELFSKFQAYMGTQTTPICYLVSISSYIVLEDMSLKGYAISKSKSDTLDFAHCKCLAETLGRFHAASIIFEEEKSTENRQYRIYDEFKHMLYDTTFSFQPGHPRHDWVNTTTDTIINLCKKINRYKDIAVEKPIRDLVEKMKEYILPSTAFRNVLNHGDLWANNIMFKYGENSTPIQCVLVDYQMVRYVPPAFDFLTFLFLTTTEDFHTKNFTSMVDIYYSTFAEELKRHNINPDEIMSKCCFLECCKYYKSPSLLEAAMFATIVYLNYNFATDILSNSDKFDEFMLTNRSKLVCTEFDKDPVFKNRMESVLIQLLNHIL